MFVFTEKSWQRNREILLVFSVCVWVLYMYEYIAGSDCLYLSSQRHYLCQILDENWCALRKDCVQEDCAYIYCWSFLKLIWIVVLNTSQTTLVYCAEVIEFISISISRLFFFLFFLQTILSPCFQLKPYNACSTSCSNNNNPYMYYITIYILCHPNW